MMNGLAHHHLGESIVIFKGVRSDFNFLFFDEIPLSKQNSPRWDAAFGGVTSGTILFLPMSHKKATRLYLMLDSKLLTVVIKPFGVKKQLHVINTS